MSRRSRELERRARAAEYQQSKGLILEIAVHEAGHAVACLAQGIKVNVIWVKGVTAEADARVRTFDCIDDDFDFDSNDGLCDNESDTDSDLRKRLIVDTAGEAAERIHQNLPADLWYESFRSHGDIAFAEKNAAALVADTEGVIEDGYAAAFELLTRYRNVVEMLTETLLTSGLVTSDELQQLWNAKQVDAVECAA